MEEEKCECDSFDNKLNYYSELFKIFNVVASSKFKDGGRCGEGEYTTILSCKKCRSHYIWDSYSGVYFDEDQISVRKYNPKTDDDGLRRVLRDLEGIINNKLIDEYSELQVVASSAVKKMKIKVNKPDENKN